MRLLFVPLTQLQSGFHVWDFGLGLALGCVAIYVVYGRNGSGKTI